MRLAFIKKRFSLHGGAERYLGTLLGSLEREGHELHIYAEEWVEAPGVVFHRVPTVSLSSFLSTLTFNRNVRKAIRKDARPDCIISFERTTCQDVYRAGEGCHAEWLEIRSGVEPFYKRLSFRMNPLHRSLLSIEKKLFAETPLIIANSQLVRHHIAKHYGVPDAKVVVIYNGVDLNRFSPENRERWRTHMRKDLHLSDNTTVLLFVGSGFERKGLKTLVEALTVLKSEDIKAVVVGRGNEQKYRAFSAGLGVADKVVFCGTQEEPERFFAAADLFVLPTLYDPFSNATLEAMASGLPVITSRNNGVSELVENGHEGFVLDSPLDAGELAEKIQRSLESHSVMGRRARERAERFPIERAVREFTGTIERAVNR